MIRSFTNLVCAKSHQIFNSFKDQVKLINALYNMRKNKKQTGLIVQVHLPGSNVIYTCTDDVHRTNCFENDKIFTNVPGSYEIPVIKMWHTNCIVPFGCTIPLTIVFVGHLLTARKIQTHQSTQTEEHGEIQHQEEIFCHTVCVFVVINDPQLSCPFKHPSKKLKNLLNRPPKTSLQLTSLGG